MLQKIRFYFGHENILPDMIPKWRNNSVRLRFPLNLLLFIYEMDYFNSIVVVLFISY